MMKIEAEIELHTMPHAVNVEKHAKFHSSHMKVDPFIVGTVIDQEEEDSRILFIL